MLKRIFFLGLSILCLNSCTVFKSIPQPRNEFRGFWVATVVNIDWPKSGNDALEKQKKDFLEILDFYKELNFNTTIVQIRTAGDAFYSSSYAPWSRFLTGKEGEPPIGNEDILAWMITETHKRGMEFHAWLNPYRATFDLNTEVLSTTHDYYKHSGWLLKYGKKYYYDPGLPEVQDHLVAVLDEVVSNYNIDGVHFDDYFYPYTIKGEVFQDAISYYNCALPQQSLEDWRRSNIDSLIKRSHQIIKNRKPWVSFGVSPFGVWKNKATDPKGSDTKAGQTTYDNLYADPLLWMEKGWLDYLIPQVYWSMDLSVASHRNIVDWWSNNSQNTNLYIGNGPYKIRNNSDSAWNNKKELPTQISYAREKNTVQGNAFFSAKSLMSNNTDVVKYLKRKYYKYPAFIPTQSALPLTRNSIPILHSTTTQNGFTVLKFNNLNHFKFVYIFPRNRKELLYSTKKLLHKIYLNNSNIVNIPLKKLKGKKHIDLVFVDKFGREYEPISIHLE